MALDHAIESFAINGQDPRGGLFVSTRVLQNLRHVTCLDL
jgi:hypothetical protein